MAGGWSLRGVEGSNGRQAICACSDGITSKAVISKEVMAFFVFNTTNLVKIEIFSVNWQYI